MKYAYLLKYKVNYVYETKYKLFSTIENVINFHKNYKHHILTGSYNSQKNQEPAFITHYEILVMELDINLNNKELNEKLN
ncbi:hypothetical protein [Spiroplasma endosymbiont of Danaus chrysippus]|uniref:hypothetical protein n=1 Tax=Spiroplasma endosymbiont of Danaus chrysippus TaxID=2691041 RepID=UPI0013CAC89C|nr:hypothetical protein [Spiroplasma endosymbiont of Danaus chrysippus]CAB1054318.1 hypothetical protein [Spiroplasma endosymbiont of Danaus chrysippus]